MSAYWERRLELPKEVLATESDEEDGDDNDNEVINATNNSDDDDDNGDDDNDNNSSGDDNPPRASSIYMPSSPRAASPVSDDENPDVAYAKYRAQKAQGQSSRYSGWQAELRAWNKYFSNKHTSNMDLCKYWEVSANYFDTILFHSPELQRHAYRYPTVARIALDILPAMASSVPAERLFSSGGETADNQRSRLGPIRFEEAQVMKWHWRQGAVDYSKAKQQAVEHVDLSEFEGLLQRDEEDADLDKACGADNTSLFDIYLQ